MFRRVCLFALTGVVTLGLCLPAGAASAVPRSVYLEELTTAEVAQAIHEGSTTVIIPVGGTEQNGPHMALGKHNRRAYLLSGRIAQVLGHTLVAPVLPYVPEGRITPPGGHMRFAGTLSVSEPAFRSILDGAARSLRQAGFRDIVLLGDSGNYQGSLRAVAAQLARDWHGSPARAHYLADYYQAAQTSYVASLKAQGMSSTQIGTHAAVADTSLMLAVDPSMVRADLLERAASEGLAGGTQGDPRISSATLGQPGVDAIVGRSVAAIRAAVSSPR